MSVFLALRHPHNSRVLHHLRTAWRSSPSPTSSFLRPLTASASSTARTMTMPMAMALRPCRTFAVQSGGAGGAASGGGSAEPRVPFSFIAKQVWKYLWPKDDVVLKKRVAISLALLASAKALNITVPFAYKRLVDTLTDFEALRNRDSAALETAVTIGSAVGTIALAYGALRLTGAFCHEFRSAVFARVTQNCVRRLSRDAFDHMMALDLRFHLNRKTGALGRVIDRGTRGIAFMLSSLLFNVAPTMVEIGIVGAIMSSQLGPKFAVVALGTIGLYAWWTISVTSWRTQFRKRMNALDNSISSRTTDSLLNYETVQFFLTRSAESRRIDSLLADFEHNAVRTSESLSLLNFGQQAIFGLGITGLMWMAAQGVVRGEMTVGDVVLVNAMLIQLFQPLNFLGSIYREVTQSIIDLENMFMLLETKPKIPSHDPAAAPYAFHGGRIEFRNVSFAYDDSNANVLTGESPTPITGNATGTVTGNVTGSVTGSGGVAGEGEIGHREILRDISFTVEAGKTVAIVGGTGSGKSTILRLLYRFEDPTSGDVIVDGQDLRSIRADSFRQHIGVVPQDNVLFNDTILYNIAYGALGLKDAQGNVVYKSADEVPREHIYRAAKMANIYDAILKMDHGFDTQVGERGLKLSGGEKQRLTIARTMMKQPKVLLCDEATGHLDPHSEHLVQQSLDTLMTSCTCVFVTHRLSAVKNADEILVLRDGRIVERGTHRRLLEGEGEYWRLFHQGGGS